MGRSMEKLEKRWPEKFNQLTTTLDKFLKRFTDFEEGLKFLTEDLKRVKAVTRDKLGVSLVLLCHKMSTAPTFVEQDSISG